MSIEHDETCFHALRPALEQRSPGSARLKSHQRGAKCSRTGLCVKTRAKGIWGTGSPIGTSLGKNGRAHSSGASRGKDRIGTGLHTTHVRCEAWNTDIAKMELNGGLEGKSRMPLKAEGRYSPLLNADFRVRTAPGKLPDLARVDGGDITSHATEALQEKGHNFVEAVLDGITSIQIRLHEISSESRDQSEHPEDQPGFRVAEPEGLTCWGQQPGLTWSNTNDRGNASGGLEKARCERNGIAGCRGFSGLHTTIAQNKGRTYRAAPGVRAYRKADSRGSHGVKGSPLGRRNDHDTGTAGVGCAPLKRGLNGATVHRSAGYRVLSN